MSFENDGSGVEFVTENLTPNGNTTKKFGSILYTYYFNNIIILRKL